MKKTSIYTIAAAAFALAAQSTVAMVTGAFWTTDSGGTIDQNHYANKCDVYLSGGPGNGRNNNLLDGTYYWQITDPNGEKGPDDQEPVLSISDASTRTVEVVNGVVTPAGAVSACGGQPSGPYDDSFNGVYKAWLIRSGTVDCNVTFEGRRLIVVNSQGNPSINSCSKTDNFLVKKPDDGGICEDGSTPGPCGCNNDQCSQPFPPTVDVRKDAVGVYDEKWPWSIAKSACLTGGSGCVQSFNQVGGSVSFNYVVTLSVGAPIRKNNEVTGVISIFTTAGSTGGQSPQPIHATGISLTDTIAYGVDKVDDPRANCVLLDAYSSSAGDATQLVDYVCTFLNDTPTDSVSGFNRATVTTANAVNSVTNSNFAEWVADFTFTKAEDIDACVTVKDTFNNGAPETLGTTCKDDATKFYAYSRSITPPQYGCVTVPNTGEFVVSGPTAEIPQLPALPQSGSDSESVRVCGPVRSGAHTMGFWQNKNGQGIIAGQQKTGVCPSGTWLRANFGPVFADLSATATCGAVGTYVTNVIKAANAGTSMSAMLKGQMLATALSVYFSSASLGGDLIKNFNGGTNVGGVDIDITKVCKNIAGCTIYDYNADEMFAYSHNTVMQLLVTASGSIWTGNVRATQETAKNVFDAINNNVAFGYNP